MHHPEVRKSFLQITHVGVEDHGKAQETAQKKTGRAIRHNRSRDPLTGWRNLFQTGTGILRRWPGRFDLRTQRSPDRAGEKKHPEDAIPLYRRQIEPILKQTNKDAYREATKLLLHLRDLMRRVGREDDFAADLATIRATHKRKRNFMKELNRAKLE